ncbi:MAG TPA: MaoC family dehydratase [Anaerolineae bacterium]|nr:MaoC family dehydratase [Anaerolineae bacterium]
MSSETLKAELTALVGTEVHVGLWLAITQERIDQFAQATEDHQWIHVDPERAKRESPFGTTIAHGYLTLSLLPYLSGYVNPEEPIYPEARWVVNYGMNRMRFPHPVKVGDRVRVRTVLQAVEEVAGGLQIISQMTIEIEGEEKPGCVAEVVYRIYF